MIDGNQADDKIIAVLRNDTVYGHFKYISEVPKIVIQRLEHYFLTYKAIQNSILNSIVLFSC